MCIARCGIRRLTVLGAAARAGRVTGGAPRPVRTHPVAQVCGLTVTTLRPNRDRTVASVSAHSGPTVASP